MACTYCYAGEKHRRSMTFETAQKAIEFAAKQGGTAFQLGFFGGEPLQEWSLLQKITLYAEEYLKDRSLVLTLTTNGIGLSKERVAWLYKHGFYLGLSVDGNREMHDTCRRLRGGKSSFNAVIDGLKNALIQPHDLEVIVVVDPSNVHLLPEGLSYLVGLGVKKISLNPNFYVEWSQEALDAFERAYEEVGKRLLAWYREGKTVPVNVIDAKIITRLKDGYEKSDRCRFGCGEIAVAPSGNIYPCERLVGEDEDGEVCIGSVYTGYDLPRKVALLSQKGNNDAECATCAVRSRCMNWCGCVNYTTTGSIDSAPGLVCFHEQLSIRVADQLAEVLYQEKNIAFLTRFYE